MMASGCFKLSWLLRYFSAMAMKILNGNGMKWIINIYELEMLPCFIGSHSGLESGTAVESQTQ